MKNWLFTLLLPLHVFADVRVMFHPYDPTLETIASKIANARQSVDIAMYNIDVNDENPIISKLKEPQIQERLRRKDLRIRMIFEGYATPEANAKKMKALEDLGLDVRALYFDKKLHHKFAIIDAGQPEALLISGSANWSMSSRNNYSENIFFVDGEAPLISQFHHHFAELWSLATEFGNSLDIVSGWSAKLSPDPFLNAHFNFDNFKLENGDLVNGAAEKSLLTREIVKRIDRARSHVEIATTRIKLRPIYDALVRAARRGVKIDIVVSMGEYEPVYRRKDERAPACERPYASSCSAGKNFAMFLAKDNFGGHENIDVRFKFFNLNVKDYLDKQMHSKYMIIDDREVLSGSFNWSYSAEYNHLENLIFIDGQKFPGVIRDFKKDFIRLQGLNREEFLPYALNLEELLLSHPSKKINCAFEPMTLELSEVDHLLALPGRSGINIRQLCVND